jgi:hypothetical protein
LQRIIVLAFDTLAIGAVASGALLAVNLNSRLRLGCSEQTLPTAQKQTRQQETEAVAIKCCIQRMPWDVRQRNMPQQP